MRVFLSHSSLDSQLALRLALDLRSEGVEVWLDQWELRLGEEYVQSIERGVDDADFVLVLLTPSSVSSPWVEREWRRKVLEEAETDHVGVIPLRGAPCQIPDLLVQRGPIDLAGGSYPLGVRHLLEVLRHHQVQRGAEPPTFELAGAAPPADVVPIVSPITLEVGARLIPLFDGSADDDMAWIEVVQAMRARLRRAFGFEFPGVRVRGDDVDLDPDTAVILLDEIVEAWLAFEPGDASDPAWAGRVVDRLFRWLEDVLRHHAASFVDPDVAWARVREVERTAPALVARTLPDAAAWVRLTEVFQRLVDEGLDLHDPERVLRVVDEADATADPVALAEAARHAFRGRVTSLALRGREELPVIDLHPRLGQVVAEALVPGARGPDLVLDPRWTEAIVAAIREAALAVPPADGPLVLVTDAAIRPWVRRMAELAAAGLVTLARREIEPGTRLRRVGRVAFTSGGDGPTAVTGSPAG